MARIVSQDRFGRQSTGFGSGTGVIFDESGLVLTNNHVTEGGAEITVTQDDGTQVVAELIGEDLLSDLAVLQIPGDGYPFLPLHQNGPLRVGDWVIAIGNALALPGGPTVTVGVVSALGRSIESTPGVTLYDLIQTDTSINPRRTPAGVTVSMWKASASPSTLKPRSKLPSNSSNWGGSAGPVWEYSWPIWYRR